MAFGMNLEGIGAQIGSMSKEGLEKLNENLDKLVTEQRRQNDITTVTVGLTLMDDENFQSRARALLDAMLSDLEYKYL